MPISNVSFSITMPKAFDPSKIGFSLGYAGASGYDTSAIQYSVNEDNTQITGSVSRPLSPQEALTIRLELPEGYYVGVRQATGPANTLLIVSLVLVGIALLLAALFPSQKKACADRGVLSAGRDDFCRCRLCDRRAGGRQGHCFFDHLLGR